MSNEGRSRTRAKGEGNLSRVAGHTVGWQDSVTAGERLELQELPLYRRRTPPVEDSLDWRRNSAMYQKRGSYPLLAGLDLPPRV